MCKDAAGAQIKSLWMKTFVARLLVRMEFCCFNASIIVETVESHEEEITYAAPVFYKRNTQKSVRQFINFCWESLYHFSRCRCICSYFCLYNDPSRSQQHNQIFIKAIRSLFNARNTSYFIYIYIYHITSQSILRMNLPHLLLLYLV